MVASRANKLKRLAYFATATLSLFVIASVASAPQLVYGAEVAVDTSIEATNSATNISSPAIVWLNDNIGYIFYEDSGGGLSVSSTTNGGTSWSAASTTVDAINTTDVVSYAVWWEGWTPGTTTTRYIHIGTVDAGVDDTYYTRYDTTTNTWTRTVLGTTQGAACNEGNDCYMSIGMTATGTLWMHATNGSDAWVVRCGQYLGCSTAANWIETVSGTNVQISPNGVDFSLLLPVGGTDNVMLVNLDTSADRIVTRIYSATTSAWLASSTLVSSIEDNTFYDAQLIGGAISTTTGHIGLAFVDDANNYTTEDHDVKFYTYATTTGWVAKTNCATDVSGGLTGAKVAYDEVNSTWYCIYGRRTTITSTTTASIYYATSTDDGATWSAEQGPVNDNADDINGLTVNNSSSDKLGATWNYTTAPRADDQYYDLLADITAPSGGGGGGAPGKPQSEFFFGFLFPLPFFSRRSRHV